MGQASITAAWYGGKSASFAKDDYGTCSLQTDGGSFSVGVGDTDNQSDDGEYIRHDSVNSDDWCEFQYTFDYPAISGVWGFTNATVRFRGRGSSTTTTKPKVSWYATVNSFTSEISVKTGYYIPGTSWDNEDYNFVTSYSSYVKRTTIDDLGARSYAYGGGATLYRHYDISAIVLYLGYIPTTNSNIIPGAYDADSHSTNGRIDVDVIAITSPQTSGAKDVDCDYYKIYRSTTSGGTYSYISQTINHTTGTNIAKTLTSQPAGANWYKFSSVSDQDGESSLSTTYKGALAVYDPSGGAWGTSDIDDGKLTATWSSMTSTQQPYKFQVQLVTDDVAGSWVDVSGGGTATSYEFTGLVNKTAYKFNYRAVAYDATLGTLNSGTENMTTAKYVHNGWQGTINGRENPIEVNDIAEEDITEVNDRVDSIENE